MKRTLQLILNKDAESKEVNKDYHCVLGCLKAQFNDIITSIDTRETLTFVDLEQKVLVHDYPSEDFIVIYNPENLNCVKIHDSVLWGYNVR